MSKIGAKKIVKEYADRLRAENYPVSAVYLFGSQAKGKAGKWSDIDVAVVSSDKKLKGNFWENNVLLMKVSLDVDNRIEPHGFTVKDFEDINDPMVYEIRKTGTRIV